MDTCKNCGMPLDDPEQELCAACRAQKEALSQSTASAHTSHTRRRRINRTTRTLLILFCVLLVVFAALCTTATVMYNKYNPDKFLHAVDAALEQQDAEALKSMLHGVDLTVSQEGAAALCRAFSEEEKRNALCAQLENQITDPGAPGEFSALGIEKEPVFFGYCRYAVTVHSVSMLLQSPMQNLVLSIDGLPRTGNYTADGVLYENMFPGSYTLSAAGTTSAGQNVTGAQTVLSVTDSSTPAVFDGAFSVSSVSVSGCVSDDAVITLDGTALDLKPQNGVVTLPQVAAGSVIGMSYTAPWGSVSSASVTFADPKQTQLSFTDIAVEGGTPSAESLDALLTAHLATYYDALTKQDTALISGCTGDYKNALAEHLVSEEHKKNIYVMESAACQPQAIKLTQADGSAKVSCYVRVNYSVIERKEDKKTEHTDYKVFTLVWEDGWKVSGSAATDENIFNNASIDALP